MSIHRAKRMTRAVSLTAACATLLSACGSQGNSDICKATNRAIDEDIVAFALTDVEGSASDTSAIQQGARATQNLSHLMMINANLGVLSQNGCSPRAAPITPTKYSSAANDCFKANLEARSASYGADEKEKAATASKMKQACDFKRWQLDKTNLH